MLFLIVFGPGQLLILPTWIGKCCQCSAGSAVSVLWSWETAKICFRKLRVRCAVDWALITVLCACRSKLAKQGLLRLCELRSGLFRANWGRLEKHRVCALLSAYDSSVVLGAFCGKYCIAFLWCIYSTPDYPIHITITDKRKKSIIVYKINTD